MDNMEVLQHTEDEQLSFIDEVVQLSKKEVPRKICYINHLSDHNEEETQTIEHCNDALILENPIQLGDIAKIVRRISEPLQRVKGYESEKNRRRNFGQHKLMTLAHDKEAGNENVSSPEKEAVLKSLISKLNRNDSIDIVKIDEFSRRRRLVMDADAAGDEKRGRKSIPRQVMNVIDVGTQTFVDAKINKEQVSENVRSNSLETPIQREIEESYIHLDTSPENSTTNDYVFSIPDVNIDAEDNIIIEDLSGIEDIWQWMLKSQPKCRKSTYPTKIKHSLDGTVKRIIPYSELVSMSCRLQKFLKICEQKIKESQEKKQIRTEIVKSQEKSVPKVQILQERIIVPGTGAPINTTISSDRETFHDENPGPSSLLTESLSHNVNNQIPRALPTERQRELSAPLIANTLASMIPLPGRSSDHFNPMMQQISNEFHPSLTSSSLNVEQRKSNIPPNVRNNSTNTEERPTNSRTAPVNDIRHTNSTVQTTQNINANNRSQNVHDQQSASGPRYYYIIPPHEVFDSVHNVHPQTRPVLTEFDEQSILLPRYDRMPPPAVTNSVNNVLSLSTSDILFRLWMQERLQCYQRYQRPQYDGTESESEEYVAENTDPSGPNVESQSRNGTCTLQPSQIIEQQPINPEQMPKTAVQPSTNSNEQTRNAEIILRNNQPNDEQWPSNAEPISILTPRQSESVAHQTNDELHSLRSLDRNDIQGRNVNATSNNNSQPLTRIYQGQVVDIQPRSQACLPANNESRRPPTLLTADSETRPSQIIQQQFLNLPQRPINVVHPPTSSSQQPINAKIISRTVEVNDQGPSNSVPSHIHTPEQHESIAKQSNHIHTPEQHESIAKQSNNELHPHRSSIRNDLQARALNDETSNTQPINAQIIPSNVQPIYGQGPSNSELQSRSQISLPQNTESRRRPMPSASESRAIEHQRLISILVQSIKLQPRTTTSPPQQLSPDWNEINQRWLRQSPD